MDGFYTQYTRARAIGLDGLADRVLKITETALVAEKRVQKADGSVEITTSDAVDRSRLTVGSLNEPRACRRALLWRRTAQTKNEPAWISDPRPAHLEGIQD